MTEHDRGITWPLAKYKRNVLDVFGLWTWHQCLGIAVNMYGNEQNESHVWVYSSSADEFGFDWVGLKLKLSLEIYVTLDDLLNLWAVQVWVMGYPNTFYLEEFNYMLFLTSCIHVKRVKSI